MAEFDIEIAFLSTGTELVELVEPLSTDSEFTRLLKERSHSGFIHHFAFRVNDIDTALRNFEQANVELVDQTPRLGADGARVAFLQVGLIVLESLALHVAACALAQSVDLLIEVGQVRPIRSADVVVVDDVAEPDAVGAEHRRVGEHDDAVDTGRLRDAAGVCRPAPP